MTASFNLKQLSATDVLVPATMKNAAKCDKQCELQNSVNHQIFERSLRPRENWGHACFSVLNEPHYHIFRGVQSVETERQTLSVEFVTSSTWPGVTLKSHYAV
jgi:hypothetical protein